MSRVHGTKNHARGLRPPGDGDCRPGAFLDVETWKQAIDRDLPYHRWGMVRGELELLGALLDGAMSTIFRPLSREHRALEVQWIFGFEGLLGTTAKDVCAWLTYCGWGQTRRGWPTDYELLCEVVSRGLELGLVLHPERKGRPQAPATRKKIALARKRACRTPEGQKQLLVARQAWQNQRAAALEINAGSLGV
jgi:hypothetical protein